MENLDFSKLITKAHEDKWIAFSRNYNKIVDFGADLGTLKNRISEAHIEVVYVKMPTFGKRYAFTQV